LDVYREFCQAKVLNENGTAIRNERFPTARVDLKSFLDRLENTSFVLKSTGVWEFVYEIIDERGPWIKLARSLKVQAINEPRVKTDKVATGTFTQLLRLGMVSELNPSRGSRDLDG